VMPLETISIPRYSPEYQQFSGRVAAAVLEYWWVLVPMLGGLRC
jgi:hypothetical protein